MARSCEPSSQPLDWRRLPAPKASGRSSPTILETEVLSHHVSVARLLDDGRCGPHGVVVVPQHACDRGNKVRMTDAPAPESM